MTLKNNTLPLLVLSSTLIMGLTACSDSDSNENTSTSTTETSIKPTTVNQATNKTSSITTVSEEVNAETNISDSKKVLQDITALDSVTVSDTTNLVETNTVSDSK